MEIYFVCREVKLPFLAQHENNVLSKYKTYKVRPVFKLVTLSSMAETAVKEHEKKG